MNNNKKTFSKLRSHRREMRLMGLGLSLAGGFVLYIYTPLLLEAGSTIRCFGVTTTSFACKIPVVVLQLLIPLAGLISLFARRKWLNRTAIWQARITNILRGMTHGS